jgi:outer membrane murein-binding lipoprotein Lpp
MFRIGVMVLAAAGAATAVAAGCASAPLKTEASTSGIRAAEEVGAANVPQASLHLQLAKEELARAKSLAANGETERADSMLRRAEVDAELAVALSREDAEKTEAQAAIERVRQLRQGNR